ncbi:hypothetical protein [Caloramator proteoclasticus]|uniref:Uncharacterized protein n=1 Tax=Caloramator proteoclasticus DSM 10124 TaxID=1121262 RepID=A0A1M4VUC4_9CLOT|nr:hypothetical protein [Caloramator proteoclasticus]SHE72559.1 hypothetical protein SAMN02746091_00993 [Caloramator proteoclasticus DSM 10124]
MEKTLSYLYYEFDNEEIIVESQNENGNDEINCLIKEYKKVVYNSLITSFGLDFILFKDIDGGNVQTVHNFEKGVYANQKFRERGERQYNREDYVTASEMNRKKKEIYKREKELRCEYTGDKLQKDGSTHLDHIVSLKELHDDPKTRMLNSVEGIKKIGNDNSNMALTKASINLSKGEKSMEEFLNTKRKGSNMTNAEYFKINKEKATYLYKQSKKKIDSHNARKLLQHYSREIGKDSILQGSKLGIRQALGIICTEFTFIIFDEIPLLVKELKNNFDLKIFWEKLRNIIEKAVICVKEKFKDILDAFKNGFISGVLSSVVTTIINMFLTTAKNVVRIIRQAIVSIKEALKILIYNPDNLPFEKKVCAACKIIFLGISAIIGNLITEAVQKLISTSGVASIPLIGEVLNDTIPIFVGTLVSGIMSISIIYFIDNSDLMRKIIKYMNNTIYDNVVNDLKEANKILDNYISKLMDIDIKELNKKTYEIIQINNRLERGEDMTTVLTDFLSSLGCNMQFKNFEEFNNCMLDKNFVLEL